MRRSLVPVTPPQRAPRPSLIKAIDFSSLAPATGHPLVKLPGPKVGTAWLLGGMTIQMSSNDAIPTAQGVAFQVFLDGHIIDVFTGLNTDPNVQPSAVFHAYQPAFTVYDASTLEVACQSGAPIAPGTAIVTVRGNVQYL